MWSFEERYTGQDMEEALILEGVASVTARKGNRANAGKNIVYSYGIR